MIRPPEGRCLTTKCFMVILKSTALSELPLNLGVEVKKVSVVYFERHARLVLLVYPRTLNYSIPSTTYKNSRRAGNLPWAVFFLFSFFFFFFLKKGTKVASSTLCTCPPWNTVPQLSWAWPTPFWRGYLKKPVQVAVIWLLGKKLKFDKGRLIHRWSDRQK